MELRRAALALLGAVALAAAACSPTTPVVAVKSQVTSTTSVFNPGGTVTVAVPYLPTNFNPSTPQGANSVTQMVMEQVWPQAFVTDPEFEEETTGFIDSAEVVGLSPMTVSYVIDPKATWSDGYPITASDFVYNWLQQLHNAPLLAPAGLLAGYRDIKSITGSNSGKTVTVVFSRPYSDWEGLFANLIPAHIAQRRGWSSAFEGFHPSRVISGGPFIVSSLQPGKRLVLSRNPRYWATPAHLQSIVFLVERSERGSLTGLRHGTVSIAQFPPEVLYKRHDRPRQRRGEPPLSDHDDGFSRALAARLQSERPVSWATRQCAKLSRSSPIGINSWPIQSRSTTQLFRVPTAACSPRVNLDRHRDGVTRLQPDRSCRAFQVPRLRA